MSKAPPEAVYTTEEITARLAASLPDWRFEDGHIKRRYKTANWPETLLLINRPAFSPRPPGIISISAHPVIGPSSR